jgi:hypothetical protein
MKPNKSRHSLRESNSLVGLLPPALVKQISSSWAMQKAFVDIKEKLDGLEKDKEILLKKNHYIRESKSRLRSLTARTTIALEDKLKEVTKQLKMPKEQGDVIMPIHNLVEERMNSVTDLHKKLMGEIQDSAESTDRMLKEQQSDLIRLFNARFNQANIKILEQLKQKDEEIQSLKDKGGWTDLNTLRKSYNEMEEFNSKLQTQNIDMRNRIKELESSLSLYENRNKYLIQKLIKIKRNRNTELYPTPYEESPPTSRASFHKTSRDTFKSSIIHDSVVSSLHQEFQSAQEEVKHLKRTLQSEQQKRHAYYNLIEDCLSFLKRDINNCNPMNGKNLNLTSTERDEFINQLTAKSLILEHVKKELSSTSLPRLPSKKRPQSVACLINHR